MTDERDAPGLPAAWLYCSNVYPLFDPAVGVPAGGMETRAALFGRGLAATGRWQVHFVVSDFGQPFLARREGIDFHVCQPAYRRAGRNVFPRLRRRDGAPLLRFDRSDLALLWQVPLIAAWLALPGLFFPRFWRRLRPGAVCCFGNNALTAEVIADCRRAGIRTMLCIASDKDLSPDYRPGNCEANHYGMPKWKGHYSLSRADRIVVQTEAQREALRRHFGRDAVLIRNPVAISASNPQHWLPRAQREYVIWIGRTDDFNKRPMRFLELARACPGQQFVMIIGRTDEAAFQALERARSANLRIAADVPAQDIPDWLSRARAFVNTSLFEGFPNTFLQSAAAGVPIVTLGVDPDGMLSSHGCGLVAADDPQALRDAVLRLCRDDALAEGLAAASHRYALERHEACGRIAEFEACLRDLAATAAATANAPPWWAAWRRFA